MFEHLKTTLPMNRLAQPEEIASVAVFLASDETSMVLGEELVADGGVSRFTTTFEPQPHAICAVPSHIRHLPRGRYRVKTTNR